VPFIEPPDVRYRARADETPGFGLTMSIAIQKPQQALAWRIEFADRALGDEPPHIREPRSAWVHVHNVNAPAALLDTTAPEGAVNGLTFVFLPSAVATPFEVQKHARRAGWRPGPVMTAAPWFASVRRKPRPRDLKRQDHINAMTRTATAMSVAYVRLQEALETPPKDLTGPARRLFLELALQADAVDRLRRLDDAIEVLEDFYGDMREQLS
jgi:hypothetical protein